MAASLELPPLQGKNLACLGRRGDEPEARVLREAAQHLGARIAWLPVFGASAAEGSVPASLLRRLYDLVVLPNPAPGQAQALEAELGLPVLAWTAATTDGEDTTLAPQALEQLLLRRLV